MKVKPAVQPERFVFGTRTHSVAQDLLEGNTPKFTDWEYEVGLGFADLTREAVQDVGACEWSFKIEVLGADGEPIAQLRGKADVVGYTADNPPIPVVIDHKTASNPKEDAETEDELRSNPQTVVYAKAAFDAHPDATEVILHWHWLPKKRRANVLDGAVVTEITFTREEAEQAFAGIVETIEQMLAVGASETAPPPYFKVTPDPLQLRCLGEATHCYPCDFVGECEDMSFLNKVKQAANQTPAVSLNPDPADKPAHPAETTAVKLEDKASADRQTIAMPQAASIRYAREMLEENGLPTSGDAIVGFLLGAASR